MPKRRLIVGPSLPLLSVVIATICVMALLGLLLTLTSDDPSHQMTGVGAIVFSAIATSMLVTGWAIARGHRKELESFGRVRRLLLKGRNDDAIEILERLLTDNRLASLTSQMHFLLGKAYHNLDNEDKAIAHYRAAQGFWPAHNNLATLYLERGDLDDAIQEFKAAILCNPGEPLLFNQLALTYQKQGETVMARRILSACLKVCPHSRATRRNLDRLDAGEDLVLDGIMPRFRLRIEV